MEFTILKDEFLQVLSQVQGVVEKKNVMPVLANVLIEAKDPILRISATDLEVAVKISTQAKVKKSGEITAPARKLFDIVRESAGEEIHVKTTDKERVEISSKQNQSQIMGLAASEFPKLPEPEGQFFPLDGQSLSEVFQKVGFAMSTDETRYHLNGIYGEGSEKGTTFVATDGHRLALVNSSIGFQGLKKGFIVPRKGVNEWKKMMPSDKTFEASVGKRHVFVKNERQVLFIRLVDGEFPNYRRVIPEKTIIEVRIPREDLVGALRRVSLLSDEYSKGVKLYFCKNAILVNTTNAEVGEAKEEIPIDYKETALEISFNAKYLLDVLTTLTEETVIMGFNDKASPCTIRSETDPEFLSVIMPMRT